jgi:hypothetical protein
MTTFTTEDRELVELQIKTFQSQHCHLTHPGGQSLKNLPVQAQAVTPYQMEDSSEDLDDWPS